RETQVAWSVIDTVEISRDAAFRGGDHQPAGVSELFAVRVVGVAEAKSASESFDGGLIAGQEVEAACRSRAAVALHVAVLFLEREVWCLRRIEADCYDIKLLARAEGDRLESADQAVQDLRAEHRAAIVDGRDD